MSTELQTLLNLLHVEKLDNCLFRGLSPERPARIFGGQVLAQSLNAAIRCIDNDELIAHSMHAYFLRPGDPSLPIIFEVDPIRNGRSFATRRVVAKQQGKAIFNTAVSFHVQESGLGHQMEHPVEIGAPEDTETDAEYFQRLGKDKPLSHSPLRLPIERRLIERRDHDNPQPAAPKQNAWFKILGDVGDNWRDHYTLLAFLSDFSLLGTALYPHPYTPQNNEMMVASLDHSIWFHQAVRVDDYLLYASDSPFLGGSRGFSRGAFYTREGQLVASTAQESLIRLRR